MKELKLRLINPPEELKAFPLNQHIYIEASEEIETAHVENNIVLIRITKDSGTLRASDLYNTNIGHVKETYSTVPLRVTQEISNSGVRLICDPIEPLPPSSNFILFLDKNISKEYINLSKTVSKGPSNLELENVYLEADAQVIHTYKLKVTSSPSISNTSNIVKFQLYINDEPSRVFTVNARSPKNRIEFNGIKILVPDVAFALGEEFKIKVESKRQTLLSNFIVSFTTSTSSSVKELENIKPSHAIDYQDVIDYYNNLQHFGESDIGIDFTEASWEKKEFTIQYLDDNSFILHLNKLSTSSLDLDAIEFRQLPAYNRSDLKTIKKYFPDMKYKLSHEVLDDKSVLFVVEDL